VNAGRGRLSLAAGPRPASTAQLPLRSVVLASMKIRAIGLGWLIAMTVAVGPASAAALSKPHLAKGGAFQYAISRFDAILLPRGFHWDPEAHGEPPGRGDTIEGEQLNVRCRVGRNAAFGACTIEYFLTEDTGQPAAVLCVQKVRARNLARRDALREARRRHEFIPRETRIKSGNAYSYHGYAILCTPHGSNRAEVVYQGD
jgi:hypothetical protein